MNRFSKLCFEAAPQIIKVARQTLTILRDKPAVRRLAFDVSTTSFNLAP